MGGLIESLSNPFSLSALIALTLLSTYFSWIGMRQRHPPSLVLGLGFGIPTFDIFNWQVWLAGAAVCMVGMWLRASMESL